MKSTLSGKLRLFCGAITSTAAPGLRFSHAPPLPVGGPGVDAHTRPDSRVEIAEAVDLGPLQESHINKPALQVLTEMSTLNRR